MINYFPICIVNKSILIFHLVAYQTVVTTRKVLLKFPTLKFSAEECHVRGLYGNFVVKIAGVSVMSPRGLKLAPLRQLE